MGQRLQNDAEGSGFPSVLLHATSVFTHRRLAAGSEPGTDAGSNRAKLMAKFGALQPRLRRLITEKLTSEPGSSLRAANFQLVATKKGPWSCSSRPPSHSVLARTVHHRGAAALPVAARKTEVLGWAGEADGAAISRRASWFELAA